MSDTKTTFGQVPIWGEFEVRPGWGSWRKRSMRTASKGDAPACFFDPADPVWVVGANNGDKAGLRQKEAC